MKRNILIFGTTVLFTIGNVAFLGCGSVDEQTKNTELHEHEDEQDNRHEVAYQCPMQCEGEKTYDKEGNCPSCGMELEKVEKHQNHEEHEHEVHDHDH